MKAMEHFITSPKRAALCIFLVLLAGGCTALAQNVVAEPSVLIGIPYEQLRQTYPAECQQLNPVQTLNSGLVVKMCAVDNHAAEIAPGVRVKQEHLLWYSSQNPRWCRLFSISIDVEGVLGKESIAGITSAYGTPDSEMSLPPDAGINDALGTWTLQRPDGMEIKVIVRPRSVLYIGVPHK